MCSSASPWCLHYVIWLNLNNWKFSPGETGIGKSTLMDTLFNTNFENFESSHFEPQVKLRAQTYDLQESNVRLRLTVVNTVGFGDQMNKQERWEKQSVCVLDSKEN